MGQSGNYYLDRERKYLGQFRWLAEASDRILPQYADASSSENVVRGNAIPIPDPGPRSVVCRGRFQPVHAHSGHGCGRPGLYPRPGIAWMPMDKIVEILHRVYGNASSSMPGLVRWFLRRQEYSCGFRNKIKVFAGESQRKTYPGNWMVEYVPGGGADFDFGFDIMACAILEYSAGREPNATCRTCARWTTPQHAPWESA
jgi:hypothetical protein